MGRYEDVLGYAQVTRIQPQFSEAVYVPLPDKPKAQPEDGVRITRGRIRVAVAPPTDLTKTSADLRRVSYMIAHALDETKRFQSPDPSVVQDLLISQKTRSEELLVRPDRAVASSQSAGRDGLARARPARAARGDLSRRDLGVRDHGQGALSKRVALVRAESVAEQRFPWEPVPQD